MPDLPSAKFHRHPVRREEAAAPPPSGAAGVPAYAELHCKTNFSFLRAASHPEEIVERAAELGYRAIAVTDRHSLAGVVRMHLAAKQHGLKLVIGAEVVPIDAPPVVLLAPTRSAYGRLCRLITVGRRRAIKGDCILAFDDVAEHSDELLALCIPRDLEEGTKGHGDEGTEGWSLAASQQRERRRAKPALHSAIRNPQSAIGDVIPSRVAALRRYYDVFGERAFLAAELSYGGDDESELEYLQALSRSSGLPPVAANDVLYHEPERRYLHDVLTSVRHQCTVHEAGRRLSPNAARYLRDPYDVQRRFAACPEAIERAVAITDACTFSLDELRYEYPAELSPPGISPIDYLTQLTWAGARQRYGEPIPQHIRGLLEHELKLIRELRYEHYFLTVWDLVRFARGRGILCQGRGSAANSAVCFCLGVTAVDPAKIDLLFERFVSRERNEPPDIDVDFEHERREEVFQYIYDKYGRDRAAITAEVITYRPRSAVRDVGKALGLSLDCVDALSKRLDWWADSPLPEEVIREAGLDPGDRTLRMVVRLTRQLMGFPRHLSQHVGGFVITAGPLCETVPIENAAMPDRTFIEWDKDDLDALGMLKVDCLALGMLTCIRKAFALLCKSDEATKSRNVKTSKRQNVKTEDGRSGKSEKSRKVEKSKSRNRRIQGDDDKAEPIDASAHQSRERERPVTPEKDHPASLCRIQHDETNTTPTSLEDVPSEDSIVYDMICNADTVGVFQVESRAQMSMLPRLRPRNFYDLVIEVAIVRPGPIQGGMVHPYLRRRNGEEPVTYPSKALEAVLGKTLGVPLFQEQAMRLAVVAAGFTPGEADRLRRAMAAWRRNGSIDRFHAAFVRGMTANGYDAGFAEQCFNQLRGFGEYGFPESHAASFALLVYVSAWLKRYHPAAFAAALLNSQPMGFYAPAQIVQDARRHGVCVRPPDVNFSAYDCTLEARCENVKTSKNQNIKTEDDAAKDQSRERERPVMPEGHPDDPATWGLDGPAMRLGLRMIRGLSEQKVSGIEAAQREGRIMSIHALAHRPDVTRETLLRLAAADAFRSLGLDRRRALWEILSLRDDEPTLFDALQPDEPCPALPPCDLQEQIVQDYDAIGLSLTAHPISLVRSELAAMGVSPNDVLAGLPQGRRVAVSGLVLVRQRPGTAKGVVFMTLEDESGVANLIIRPRVWERWRRAARSSVAVIAEGTVERQGAVVHVMATRITGLSERIEALGSQSRDFH